MIIDWLTKGLLLGISWVGTIIMLFQRLLMDSCHTQQGEKLAYRKLEEAILIIKYIGSLQMEKYS